MNRPNKFLAIFVLLLLLCGTAVLFRDQLLGPVARQLIVKAVAAELGLEVTVEQISGGYFRDLKLTGVRTVKPSATGMLVSLEAATIQARYSLPALRQGVAAFLADLRLELDGARVAMDFSRDWQGGAGAEGTPATTLVLPVTRARNSSVALRGQDWALTLSGLDLAVAAFDESQGGIPLSVHAAQSLVEMPFMHPQTPELAARGVLTLDAVRVDVLEVNGVQTIEAARFDYAAGEPFSWALSFAAFGGSGKVSGVFPDASTSLVWEIGAVDVSRVAPLFVSEFPLSEGIVTSRGALVGDFADPAYLAGTVALEVVDGRVRNIPFEHLALTGASSAGVLRIDSLEAAMGGNLMSAAGVTLPLSALVAGDPQKTIRNTRGRFAARLEDIPALLALAGIAIPKEHLAGGIPPHRLVVAGNATAGGITLESGTFSEGHGTVTLEHGEITWPRPGPSPAGLGLSARLSARIPELGRTAAIFGVEDVEGAVQAEVTLDGPWSDLEGSIEVHGQNLSYRTGGVENLHLVARSDPEGWRIVNLEAGRGEDRFTGSGVVALDPLIFRGLTLDFAVKDFQPYLGWFLVGEMPAVRGGLDGHFEFSGSPMAPEGSFRVALAEAVVGGISVSRGELVGTLAGETITVTTLEVQTPEGRAALAGSLHHRNWALPVAAVIDRLTLARQDLSLQLLEPVTARVDGTRSWSFGEATLRGEGGTLSLGGGESPQKGYDLAFRVAEFRSAPLRAFFPELPVEFSGLNLEGTVTGPPAAPDVALAGAVAELRAPDAFVPLAGQFDLRFSARGMVLKAFSWTTATGEQISLSGTIPYNPYTQKFIPEELAVDGLFSVPDLGVFTAFLPEDYRVPGTLHGTLRVSGSGEHPEAAIDLHARDLGFPASLPLRPTGPVSVDAVAVLKDNDLRLERLNASGSDLNLSVSGIWRQAGDLLRNQGPAAGLPGTLDLRGTFSLGDIGWLARGVPAIRRLGGKVAGALAVSGPAAKPELSGELTLADGEFRPEGTMPPLRNLQAQFELTQGRAAFERFTGTIGGSPFTVEGSVVLSPAGAPMADLRVQGSNILLYRSEGIGVRGDADITIRGLFTAPAFAGTVAITDGRLRRNFNWLEPFRDLGRSKAVVVGGGGGLGVSFHNPPLKDASFDIHLTSRTPFRVWSNVARGALRPDLRLRGTGEIPQLTGVVYIDPSRVLLPAGRLSVESGLVRFPEKGLGRPMLEISGSSRILGYDISVTVEGSYDEPTVTLSSVPPLPQDALLLLLLTGKLPPGVAAQNGGWQGGVKVALYLGKGVLEEWLGGSGLDSEDSLLERFDVITGRGISRQGNETIGAQYRLADGVVRDGDELYLVAERDIYDEFNAGLRIVFQFK